MRREIWVVVALIVLANILKTSPIYLVLYLIAMAIASWRLWRDLPKFFVLAFSIGFLAEIIGTRTCIPFGCYRYVNLQPQILGVGLFVPFAWSIFGFFTYLAAGYFTNNRWKRVLLASILMVLLDLAVDPLMTSWKAWVWSTHTAINWFGIPWTNYAGWFIVSFFIFSSYHLLQRGHVEREMLVIGPPTYILEMLTFLIYSPTAARYPVLISTVFGIAFISSLFILFRAKILYPEFHRFKYN